MRTRSVLLLGVLLLGGCAAGGPTAPGGGASSSGAPSSAVAPPSSAGPSGSTPQPSRSPSQPAHVDSGIVGMVVVVGGCPVDRADPPCPPRPAAAPLVVADAGSNATVATVNSGADGAFRVTLAPGRYVVRAAATGPLMSRAAPVTVDVPAGGYVSVTVSFQARIP